MLLEGRGLGSLTGVTGLQLGGLRVARLERQLGEVEGQLDLLELLRRHTHEQLLHGGAEADAQVGEHLEVRATMPGLDAGDVTHRHVGAGEVGLGHSLGHARGAQPVTQLGWVDLPQQVRLTGIHVRQCDRTGANPVKNGISRTLPAQMANWSRQALEGRRSASRAPSSPGPCALRRATAGSFRGQIRDAWAMVPMARTD